MDTQMPVRARRPGYHEAAGPPVELIAGWVIRCTCGWTNDPIPACTAQGATDRFAAHAKQRGSA